MILHRHLSRPMRARGSKHRNIGVDDALRARRAPCGRVDRNDQTAFFCAGVSLSRPMRARGSKPNMSAVRKFSSPVAPHAGAWIET